MRFHFLALVAPLHLLAISVPSVAETLRITNGEWPPFTSHRLPDGGPLSRTVAEAFKQVGITVEYGYFPWKRAYDYARSGAWDGSVGWAKNAAHQKDFVMSETVIHVDKVLFYRKAAPIGWLRVEDLKRWRLGATTGYSYGEAWDHAVRNGFLRVETVTLDAQNLRKLLENRLDAVAMDLDVGLYLLRTAFAPHQAEQITYHPRSLSRVPISLALSRHNPASPSLIERFNQGLAALRSSGRLDDFLTEYQLMDPVFREATEAGTERGARP